MFSFRRLAKPVIILAVLALGAGIFLSTPFSLSTNQIDQTSRMLLPGAGTVVEFTRDPAPRGRAGAGGFDGH